MFFDTGRDVKYATPERTEQTLMTGSRKQMTTERRDVNGHITERLRCIKQEINAVVIRDSADRLRRLNRSGDIRRVDQRDKSGFRNDRLSNRVGINVTLAITRHVAG